MATHTSILAWRITRTEEPGAHHSHLTQTSKAQSGLSMGIDSKARCIKLCETDSPEKDEGLLSSL